MKPFRTRITTGALVAITALAFAPRAVRADEGGASFWPEGWNTYLTLSLPMDFGR